MAASYETATTALRVLRLDAEKKDSFIELYQQDVPCMLCDKVFHVADNNQKGEYLKHLLEEHKFVIGEVEMIANLRKYAEHWKRRFNEGSLREFCKLFETKADDIMIVPNEHYAFLCDAVPEDRELRKRLQAETLGEVLAQQHKEREDKTEVKECPICKLFSGTRTDTIHHMANDHGFQFGHPNNIVFIEEFIQLVNEKLSNLLCLYCEKTFPDRHTAKEHMRKKFHKKLNPKNTDYDKYYIINYLEFGKKWEEIQQEKDNDPREEDPQDWSDWQEDCGAQALCLFCTKKAAESQPLMDHMKTEHGFNMEELKRDLKLTFYQQVKLVNYIRRQVHLMKECLGCPEKFASREELVEHLKQSGHIDGLSNVPSWDQPQYFFSSFEDDTLLCFLDADGDDIVHDPRSDTCITEGMLVVSESIDMSQEKLKHAEKLKQELTKSGR